MRGSAFARKGEQVMTVMQMIGFGSLARPSKQRLGARRKRGTTLIELVLYIGIATVIMTFSIGLLREEQIRSERAALAGELSQAITSTQSYVTANYESIRDQLLADTLNGQDLIRAYNLTEAVAAGFLPAFFANGTAPKSFAESFNFAIAVRAVLRGDTTAPPATLTRTNALLNPVVAGQFRQDLIDNRFVRNITGTVTNDELDLEVLLISIANDPCTIVPFMHSSRIISQSGANVAGYVTGVGNGQGPAGCDPQISADPAWTLTGTQVATGPYGQWQLQLAPYAALTLTAAEFPGAGFGGDRAVQAGRFASLMAVQNRSPLSESARVLAAGDSAFRCSDVPVNSAEALACQQSGLMYSGISFNSWDSDANGIDDRFPGISDVNAISMASRTDANGVPIAYTAAPQVSNVLSLSCTRDDVNSTLDDVLSEPGKLSIDCPETTISGLVITAGNVTANSLVLNGADVEARLVQPSTYTFPDANNNPSHEVQKPTCPTGLDPDISVTPATYAVEGVLRGVNTVIDDSNPNKWTVDLKVSYEEDATGSVTTLTNPRESTLSIMTGCR